MIHLHLPIYLFQENPCLIWWLWTVTRTMAVLLAVETCEKKVANTPQPPTWFSEAKKEKWQKKNQKREGGRSTHQEYLSIPQHLIKAARLLLTHHLHIICVKQYWCIHFGETNISVYRRTTWANICICSHVAFISVELRPVYIIYHKSYIYIIGSQLGPVRVALKDVYMSWKERNVMKPENNFFSVLSFLADLAIGPARKFITKNQAIQQSKISDLKNRPLGPLP